MFSTARPVVVYYHGERMEVRGDLPVVDAMQLVWETWHVPPTLVAFGLGFVLLLLALAVDSTPLSRHCCCLQQFFFEYSFVKHKSSFGLNLPDNRQRGPPGTPCPKIFKF